VAQPRQYVSSAVLRLSSSQGGNETGWKLAQTQRMRQLQQAALSRKSLSAIIQAQNLFQKERKERPLEEIVQEMRSRSIKIRATEAAGGTTFRVDFAGSDPAEAQAGTRAIVTALVEQNLTQVGAGGIPSNIEVIDPASLPSEPSTANRTTVMGRFVGLGLALGLVSGTLWWVLRRRKVSLWRIGGFAVAGMAVGVGVGFVVPDQFISTAVLRTADATEMQSTVTRVLSDEAVAALIRRQGLFTKDVSSDGIDAVTLKVRKRIRVQAVETEPDGASAVVISFQYPDRFVAQKVTQDLARRFTGKPNTEILDPASDPQAPSSPNRMTIALLGVLCGALLGLAASYLRRNTPVTA